MKSTHPHHDVRSENSLRFRLQFRRENDWNYLTFPWLICSRLCLYRRRIFANRFTEEIKWEIPLTVKGKSMQLIKKSDIHKPLQLEFSVSSLVRWKWDCKEGSLRFRQTFTNSHTWLTFLKTKWFTRTSHYTRTVTIWYMRYPIPK